MKPEVVSDNLDEVLDEAMDRAVRGAPSSELRGWTWPEVDRLLRGMRGDEFAVIGGVPGAGKTSFCLDVVRRRVRAGYGHHVVFSYEMPKLQIAQKLACQDTGIPFDFVDTGKLGENSDRAAKALVKYEEALNFFIGKISVLDVRRGRLLPEAWTTIVENKIRQHGEIGGVFIDYIQLLGGRGSMNEKMTVWSQHFRLEAQRLSTPTLCISALKKGIAERMREDSSVRPTYEDYKDSNAIGYEATKALFVLMGKEEDERLLFCAKNRFGPFPKELSMEFKGKCQSFWTNSEYEEELQTADS